MSWYEKLGFGCFFMFIYERQFMADSVNSVVYILLSDVMRKTIKL